MRIRKGFTLIELLVVISIIALLLSIILPSLRLAKETSRSLVCKTRLKEIGLGLYFYGNNYDECFPSNDVLSGQMNNLNLGGTTNVAEYMFPDRLMTMVNPYLAGLGALTKGGFIEDTEIFYCPTEKKEDYDFVARENYSSYSYRGTTSTWLASNWWNCYGADKTTNRMRAMVSDHFTRDEGPHSFGRIFNLWYSDGHVGQFEFDQYNHPEIANFSTDFKRQEVWELMNPTRRGQNNNW